MTDKEICQLDMLPNPRPRLRLRCTWRVDKITPDLNMAAKDNGAIWRYLFRDLYERRHLRIVQDHNISASIIRCTQGAARSYPISVGIVVYPIAHSLCVFIRETFIRPGDSLEDVVVCFGDTEHARTWLRDIPIKESA